VLICSLFILQFGLLWSFFFFCSTLSIHKGILLVRANGKSRVFEWLWKHLLKALAFVLFTLQLTSNRILCFLVMFWAFSTSHSVSWASGFLTSFVQIFIHLYIHSSVSGHVLLRTEFTQSPLWSRILSI
jgi:hypothetical protein